MEVKCQLYTDPAGLETGSGVQPQPELPTAHSSASVTLRVSHSSSSLRAENLSVLRLPGSSGSSPRDTSGH